jgi:two-component system chemotaxis response regulator CheY
MKRLLIIDDAATVRMYHRGILESAGYAVDEAFNGLEAFEKILAHKYYLYLVDVNMPKLDGYALLRQLRMRGDLPQVPAIMISTECESGDRVKAFEAGANFYLVKPMRPETLIGYVRAMLGEAGK